MPVVDQSPAGVDRGRRRQGHDRRCDHRDCGGAAAARRDARQPEPGGDQDGEEDAARELPARPGPGDGDQVERHEQDERADPTGDAAAGRPEGREGGQPDDEWAREQDHEARPGVGAGVGDRDVTDSVEAPGEVGSELVPVRGQ